MQTLFSFDMLTYLTCYIWLFSMIFNIRMNQNGKKCYTGTCFMLRYCFTPQLDNEWNLYCYSQKKNNSKKKPVKSLKFYLRALLFENLEIPINNFLYPTVY